MRGNDVEVGSRGCRRGDATRCRDGVVEFNDSELNSGRGSPFTNPRGESSGIFIPQRDSMREEPGDPARLPPPRSLPGVTAPEGGERANSS